MHARVISETDARKGRFGHQCAQSRKAIMTDSRNGLVGHGCAQGLGHIRLRTTYIPDVMRETPCRKPL